MAGVIALLNRDHAQRAEHILVHNVDDAAGGRHQINVERIGNRLHRALGAFTIQLKRPAQEVFGEIAKNDIGVCDRWQFTALAISDGAGDGTCRLRADAQGLCQFRHIGDGAAACAHCLHIQRGGADGQVADFGCPLPTRFQIFNKGNVGGRAADIQG